MKRSLGTTIMGLAIAVGLVAGASAGTAKDSGGKVAAQSKVAKGKKGDASSTIPAGVTVNACGCYRTEAGACFCGDKNGRCACPGDCEPMGCEQKRAKEIQREVDAETKKAQDEEKKRQADEAAAAAARTDAGPPSSGESVVDDADEGSEKKAEKVEESKPEKRGVKGRKNTVAKP